MVAGTLNDDQMAQLYGRALRFAREECPAMGCPIESELIACVQESVQAVSEGISVHAFVPILAMRRVRQCILAGRCDINTQGANP